MKVDPDNIDRVQEAESDRSKKKGLFSRLFSKKNEEENPLADMNENIEEEIEEEEKESEEQKEKTDSNNNLEATIEQLKAQINALGEFRKTTNERFLQLSEEIGQIRESGLTREKEISNMTLSVSHAIDLVEQVHPEKLEELSNKQNSEIQKLTSKIESNRSMNENILVQIKEIRDKTSIFNDVDDILKLNKEITDKLLTVQRLESVVDQHSSKIEQFFIKIEKQYQEFERFEHDRKELESSYKTLIKEFDKLKTNVSDAATIKDLNKLEDDMSDMNQINLESINVLKKQLAVLEESLSVLKDSESQEQKDIVKETIKNLEGKLATVQSHIEEHSKKLEVHNQYLGRHEAKLNEHNQHIMNLKETLPKFKDLENTNKGLDKQLKNLSNQVDLVRDSVRIHNQKIMNHDKHIELLHKKTDNNSYSARQPFGKPFDALIMQTHLALEAGSLKLAKKLYNKLRIEFLDLPQDLKTKELMLVIRSIFEIINTETIVMNKKQSTEKKHHHILKHKKPLKKQK